MAIVRSWKRASRAVLAVMTAAIIVGGTATNLRAHAGDGDTGKVHACVTKKGGKVRIVGADPSLSCKGTEDPLHFAIQGEPGAAGPIGTPGREGRSALTVLQPGETITGVWGASYTAQASGESYRAFASFPIPLEADIPDGKQIYVLDDVAPHCPGLGQADPGYLCVYQGYEENSEPPGDDDIFDPSSYLGNNGASRFGFGIYLSPKFSGRSAVSGTYSVTVP
ncbi:MAG TPA: hypothetical protein VGR62_20255 [Candidatus Binatia bacterium]|jgi:hypothetical protein|nr:hypothetical protein [Candidatus Binatia bacterium]